MNQFKKMGFKTSFKSGKAVSVSDVWWEAVQEWGGGAAECSTPGFRQTERRNSEVNRGIRSKCVGRCSGVKEMYEGGAWLWNLQNQCGSEPGASGAVEERR